MYLLVTLFLIFQVNNVSADNAEVKRLDVEQTVTDIERFQDDVAEATDKKLGQTENRSLKEKIYKAFEKIIQCTDAIIDTLHLKRN